MTWSRVGRCSEARVLGDQGVRERDVTAACGRVVIRYTVIGTRYEEIITPDDSQFLHGGHVTNILLQDQCATDFVDHLASSYDSIALRDVLNALDPAHAQPPTCTVVLPGAGG